MKLFTLFSCNIVVNHPTHTAFRPHMLGTDKFDYAKKYCLLHVARSYQGKMFKVCDSLVCKGISPLLALFPKLWLLWAVCRAVFAKWGKIYVVHVETRHANHRIMHEKLFTSSPLPPKKVLDNLFPSMFRRFYSLLGVG
jgi:hypothetical protein